MTEGHNTRGPHAIVRYPVLFLFGPIFLAGALRADPPFSAGLKVDGTALLGSLFWLAVVFDLAGLGPGPEDTIRPTPGTPGQIEVMLNTMPALAFGIVVGAVGLILRWWR